MAVIENLMEDIAAKLRCDPYRIRNQNCYGNSPRDLSPYGQKVETRLPQILNQIHIFYMKMTTGQQMASQPQPQEGMPDMRNMMKYMIYFAPIMMMVFFNNYSSGLSLYYFVSNLLSIAIMFTIKNYILDERKIRQQIQFNKSQPVKPPSRFQRRMQAIMEEAERQKKNK